MKFNMLFISAAVLFSLTAQIFSLTSIASADGCGTNPLGDTSGDTDFYVSKNQNFPASEGLTPAPAASNEGKAAVSLGSSVEPTEENVTLRSLNPDRASPQAAGLAIVWTANASSPDDDEIVYDFFLKGPATNGELIEKTGWITENSWTWNTSDADIGENEVQVRVKRLGAGEAEVIGSQNFNISAANTGEQVTDAAASREKSTSSELNPHPEQKTSEDETDKAPTTNQSSPASGDINPHPGGKTEDREEGEASTTSESIAASGGFNPYPGGKTASTDVRKPRTAPDEKNGVDDTADLADEVISTQDPLSASSDVMDVGGRWTVDLVGSGCTLDIKNLIQTGESVVGMGDLIERNTKIPQTFRGTVTSTSLKLRSKAVIDEFNNNIDKSVSLNLEKADWSISGSYELYSGDELTAKGNATASRFSS